MAERAFDFLRGLVLAFAHLLVIGEDALGPLILRAQVFDRAARGFLILPKLAVLAAQRRQLFNEPADFFLNIIDFVHVVMIPPHPLLSNI